VRGWKPSLGTLEGPIRRQERGGDEWQPIKFVPKDELGVCPKFTAKDSHTSLPRSRSHNRPTNPRNTPQLKATWKRNSRSKGLRQLRSPRRTVWSDGADGPRVASGRSARSWRTVRNSKPNLQFAPSKIQTVRELTANSPLLADGPASPGGRSGQQDPTNTYRPNGLK
jgi:hypothetical protein